VYNSQQQQSFTATGNSHVIWDHTVLYMPPGKRRETRLYPQPK